MTATGERVASSRHGDEPAAATGSAGDTGIIAYAESHAWPIFGGLMLIDAVLLLYMGRGLTFFFDDWDFVTHDYGGGLHSLLAGHGGNLVLFPVAIYKVLFHIVGLNHYAVFRVVVIGLHLVCAALVFVLASRRIPRAPALLAGALILFLGAAWEDLLWAFQVTYMLSIASGLAAWVLIERDDRWSEVAAMLCLVVALGSSSLGIAITIGVAVELARRRRWRSSWIVVVPAFLYAIWYLHYGESQITRNGLINAPGFAEDLAAAAFGGLVGRALEWGRPLALIGLLLVLRRVARPTPVSARLAGLLTTGLALWAITAVARSTISQPGTSRYTYLGAVVIVLIGVELLRDVTISSRATGLAALLVGVCAVTGLTVLHTGAMGLRATSRTVTAELGALELAATHAPADYRPDPQRAPQIQAGPYLHTVRAIGSSPADTPTEIAVADPISRAAADVILLTLDTPTLAPLGSVKPSSLAPAPTVSAVVSGKSVQHGSCIGLTRLPGPAFTANLTLPDGGVAIRDEGNSPGSLAFRRFGEPFDQSAEAVMPHSAVELSPVPDSAPAPWQLQVTSMSPFSVCGLRP